MPKQALVLYSSVAGSISKLREQIGQIVEDLCEHGDYVANVRPLKPGMRGADIFSKELGKIDLVISAGGDGTLRHTLGGAAEVNLEAPIGIIPLGTGNLLAKNLGIYKGDGTPAEAIDYALDIIKQGHSVPLDLGKANDDYFIVAVGVGPVATAIARPGSRTKRSLKMFAYTMPLLKTIFRKEVPFKIVADGKTIECTAGGIFVSNARDMGIGCNLNANEYNDGYFDLCIFSADDLVQGMKIAFRFGSWFLAGIETDERPYEVHRVKEAYIESPKRLSAILDGDRSGKLPLHVKVVPHAVNVFIPHHVEHSECEQVEAGQTMEPTDRQTVEGTDGQTAEPAKCAQPAEL